MTFSNKQLYELRQELLRLIECAKELDALTPEQLKQYNIQPSNHARTYINEDSGKFIDDFYHYAYIKDIASADPFTHDEIEKMKNETKDVFNSAMQLLYKRDCVFESIIEYKFATDLNTYADRVHKLELAIIEATERIVPEYGFYKKSYSKYIPETVLKQIDVDIALYEESIKRHQSAISSIGYEHYEDTEYGDEVDYDINERYKPHEDAIKQLRENIRILESYKAKFTKDITQEESKTQKGTEQSTKKKNFFKLIAEKLKRKKKNLESADSTKSVPSNEESTTIEHSGGAWHSDW